jgi:hypothetical protein
MHRFVMYSTKTLLSRLHYQKYKFGKYSTRSTEILLYMLNSVSGEGLPLNWMILLGHRRLQYIGEEPLGVAGG